MRKDRYFRPILMLEQRSGAPRRRARYAIVCDLEWIFLPLERGSQDRLTHVSSSAMKASSPINSIGSLAQTIFRQCCLNYLRNRVALKMHIMQLSDLCRGLVGRRESPFWTKVRSKLIRPPDSGVAQGSARTPPATKSAVQILSSPKITVPAPALPPAAVERDCQSRKARINRRNSFSPQPGLMCETLSGRACSALPRSCRSCHSPRS